MATNGVLTRLMERAAEEYMDEKLTEEQMNVIVGFLIRSARMMAEVRDAQIKLYGSKSTS